MKKINLILAASLLGGSLFLYPGKIPLSNAYKLVAHKITDKTYADDAKRALIPLATTNFAGQLIIERSVVVGIIENALGLMNTTNTFAGMNPAFQKVLLASTKQSSGTTATSTSSTLTSKGLETALKKVIQEESSLTGPAGKQASSQPATPAMKLPPYLQLVVDQQKGYSCGFHAVFNALAMQTLFGKAKELTSASIMSAAEPYHPQIVRTDVLLTYKGVNSLAKGNELKNFFLLSYHGPTKKIGFTDLIGQSISDVNTALTKVKTSASGLIHFICNPGEHWVTISVIKRIGENPFLLYMDSLNRTVAERKVVAEFLNYLHARLK